MRRNIPVAIKPQENYIVSFLEVSFLIDAGMAFTWKLLFKALTYGNYTLLANLAHPTKKGMQINSDIPHEQFLQTGIKDYHHVMTSIEI